MSMWRKDCSPPDSQEAERRQEGARSGYNLERHTAIKRGSSAGTGNFIVIDLQHHMSVNAGPW